METHDRRRAEGSEEPSSFMERLRIEIAAAKSKGQELAGKPTGTALIQVAFLDHHAAMTAIRELEDAISPLVAELDDIERLATERFRQLSEETPEDVREPVNVVVALFLAAITDVIRAGPGATELAQTTDIPNVDDIDVDTVSEDPRFLAAAKEALDVLRELVVRRSRLDLVRGSLVVMITNALDSLLLRLAEGYYRVHPGALLRREHNLSLEELEGATSFADIEDVAIAKRVEDLGYGDYGGWAKFFSSIGLELADLPHDVSFITELYERRHAIVHHGGQVSRRYKQRVGEPPHPGGLEPSKEYLATAIDEAEVFGFSLAVRVWLHLAPGDATMLASEVDRVTLGSIQAGRPQIGARFGGHVLRVLPFDEGTFQLRFNVLLARRRLAGVDDIRNEVETLLAADRPPAVRAALLALVDHPDAPVAVVAALKAGHLARGSLVQWPVFDEIRTHPQIVAAQRETGDSDAETGGTPS